MDAAREEARRFVTDAHMTISSPEWRRVMAGLLDALERGPQWQATGTPPYGALVALRWERPGGPTTYWAGTFQSAHTGFTGWLVLP